MASKRSSYEYFSKFRGFDRDVKLLLLNTFLTAIVLGLFTIIQPLFLNALGYDSVVIGFLLGISGIVSVFVLLPAGILANRYGNRNLLIAGLLAYALALIIYAIFTDYPLLLIASSLTGVAFGAYAGPSNAILTDKSKFSERNFVFSLSLFLSAFALIIGSFLAGAPDFLLSILHTTQLESYRIMFWIAMGLVLISLPGLFLVSESSSIKNKKKAFSFKSWRLAGLFSVSSGLIGFGAGTFVPLLPLYLSSKFAATEFDIGILFAASNAAMGVVSLFAPKLSEKIGPVATITLTQTISIIPLVTIPFLNIFYWAALLYIIRTGLMNMSSPILNAYTMSLVPQDERASTSGVTTMAWNGANALGIIVSGILMSINLDLPFYIGSLFYASASIFFYIFFRARQLDPSKD